MDLDRVERFWENNQDEIIGTIVSIVFIIVLLWIVQMVVRRLVGRALHTIVSRAESKRVRDAAAIKRRADTTAATVSWVLEIFLIFVGAAFILAELGVNVTALVAGLGIVGIGLGMGAQTLVKDVINGIFILIEDQYGVGDVVEIAGVSGVVTEINPRRTVLRDLSGNVHIIPNSAIVVATNMTADFSRINLDVGVAYEEDINHVIAVTNEVCEELARDKSEDIITVPSVLRVNDLGDSSVIVKVTGDVRIGTQWALMGELRRRLKVRFDEEGIEIPYPQRATVTKVREPEIKPVRKLQLQARADSEEGSNEGADKSSSSHSKEELEKP
jgi:moderate conductance mechanosensitive channel